MFLLFALVDTGHVTRISCCGRDQLAPKGKYTQNLLFGKSPCDRSTNDFSQPLVVYHLSLVILQGCITTGVPTSAHSYSMRASWMPRTTQP
jgi:hypothetical protein